jgi:hypothetical protein
MAFSFNGSSSYIEATSTPVTAEPFTMACWFNTLNNSAGGSLMSIGNSSTTNRFQLNANGNAGNVGISAVGSTTQTASTSTNYTTNVWHHAAAVCGSSSNRSAYLNGGGKQSNNLSVTPAGINNIIIGSRWNGGSRGFYFGGRIAEVAIWNIALTDDEILSLSKGFAPSLIRPMNLRFYNRCIRNSTDISQGRSLVSNVILPFDHPRIYG